VAFSGALPPAAEGMTIDSVTPVWVAEGLPAPTMDDLFGSVYLHPFPPAFGQVPSSGSVRPMRAEGRVTGDETPSWLAGMGSDRPLVYLTFGTEPIAEMAPWAAAVEAIGSLDIEAVATIGSHVDMALLGSVPPNLHVERFVPQHLILERAAAVVSHAGAGSLLGAAARGLPQVLTPVRADQWENADAATDAGVAITCELDQRSSADIGAALERLLNDPGTVQAARRVAAEIAGMPGPRDHVSTIEALVDH
jgi:UDP:flavonoid glycosyltransferase YjiC (YdhE family)